MPTKVVNLPTFFDLVQPDSDTIEITEIIPTRKAMMPATFGNVRSPSIIFNGYPSVVIIKILVIANIVTRKEPVARVANLKICDISLFEDLPSNNNTKTVRENPPKRALINSI